MFLNRKLGDRAVAFSASAVVLKCVGKSCCSLTTTEQFEVKTMCMTGVIAPCQKRLEDLWPPILTNKVKPKDRIVWFLWWHIWRWRNPRSKVSWYQINQQMRTDRAYLLADEIQHPQVMKHLPTKHESSAEHQLLGGIDPRRPIQSIYVLRLRSDFARPMQATYAQ